MSVPNVFKVKIQSETSSAEFCRKMFSFSYRLKNFFFNGATFNGALQGVRVEDDFHQKFREKQRYVKSQNVLLLLSEIEVPTYKSEKWVNISVFIFFLVPEMPAM